MAGPIPHHRATGIHPGAFVQRTEPDTSDVQDGVLWLDTSAGPPYQLKRWDAGASAWHPVQMDATGYPLPRGNRIEERIGGGGIPDPTEAPSVEIETVVSGLPAGTYIFAYTFVDATGGETLPSPGTAVTSTSPAFFAIFRPTLPDGVYDINVYLLPPSPSEDIAIGFVVNFGGLGVIPPYAITGSTPESFLGAPQPPEANTTGSSVVIVDPLGTVGLQVPLPTLTEPPASLVGKDPADGLPKWIDDAFLARKEELPVDTGGRGQLPADDSALPDDPPVPTTIQTDKLIPAVALPDPIIDNCPIMRCGAAYYLAQKLKEQYDIVRNCLLGMLAAPLLLRIPAATAPMGITILDLVVARLSDALIGEFGADILWLTRIVTKLNRWLKVVGAGFSVARDFEDLGEDGNTKLQRLAYPCLTCSENIFNLSQDMLVAWELAINADTTDFTDWQRHLLVYILQCTPFGIYHTVAAQGAAITSDTCGGF